MKIVSVMTTAAAGGAEFAAVEMLDALAAAGHETVMLSNRPDIGRGTRVRVAPVDLGPKLALDSKDWIARRFPLLVRRLRRALEAEAPYDALLLHYKKEQVLARWLPPRLRPVLAWCEWGIVPFQFDTGVARRLYQDAGRRADVVMAISRGTAVSVAAHGVDPARIHEVPNVLRVDEIGFDPEARTAGRARLGVPDDGFLVGCVSRLDRKKKVEVLIDAVAALEDPRAHLLLAGDGERRAEHTARARELLGDRAHVIDTPTDDLVEVLSAMDASVFCPSPTEGQPRAVILGMLAERPVLSTGPMGVDDMIAPEFGAITERAHDPAALVPLLRRYLDDPELRRTHGAAARRVAEATYAAPVVAGRIADLLRAAGAPAG